MSIKIGGLGITAPDKPLAQSLKTGQMPQGYPRFVLVILNMQTPNATPNATLTKGTDFRLSDLVAGLAQLPAFPTQGSYHTIAAAGAFNPQIEDISIAALSLQTDPEVTVEAVYLDGKDIGVGTPANTSVPFTVYAQGFTFAFASSFPSGQLPRITGLFNPAQPGVIPFNSIRMDTGTSTLTTALRNINLALALWVYPKAVQQ